jgi:hypothetical protein
MSTRIHVEFASTLTLKERNPMPVRDAFHSGFSQPGVGYALWAFQAGAWVVQKVDCGEGYWAGDPPRQAGKFEGEIVKKACEPDLSSAPMSPAYE